MNLETNAQHDQVSRSTILATAFPAAGKEQEWERAIAVDRRAETLHVVVARIAGQRFARGLQRRHDDVGRVTCVDLAIQRMALSERPQVRSVAEGLEDFAMN